MCIVTTLNQGLRNGGGIGDILRSPGKNVRIILNYSATFTEFGLNRYIDYNYQSTFFEKI